ncbi:MAG: M13 family metallopeptidase [Bacteroidales bacterium]|nr:M13 family metallopeptidase [Bacteroidales bacterium]
MKKVLTICMIAFALASCNEKMAPVMVDGLQFDYLDESVDPKQDFYQYANGGWMEKNPLPAEYARFGSFDMLAANVQKQLKELVDTLSLQSHEQGSAEQKIADLYRLKMDSLRLNQEGNAPIQPILKTIKALENKAQVIEMMAQLNQEGIWPFFAMYVSADDMNSSMNILHSYQAGIGMSDRDYYLKEDARSKSLRAKYQQFVAKMFVLAGYPEKTAKTAAKEIMQIETALAKAQFNRVELRDPYKNYHKMSLNDLQQLAPGFDWQSYFKALGMPVNELNVSQDVFMKEMAKVFNSSSMAAIKYYLAWNVISDASSSLSDDFANLSFDFYGKTLSGRQEQSPRWKRAVSTLDNAVGQALGITYVNRYFPAAAKERMVELVANLQVSLGERIDQLAWMSDETKQKAHEKLAAFRVKIGYPDQWKDYSALQIDATKSLYDNLKAVARFNFEEEKAKVGKPVDRDEWLMTPQTVNAYYNPTTNEICFPAGILQPPFFFQEGDDAVNYGAIGVVIGHEMTHGFDDQGSRYDKDGNLSNWWTESDGKQFAERTKVLEEYFNHIEVAPGVMANGAFTLGENIADNGGLQVSYNAFKKTVQGKNNIAVDGVPADQRFFIAYAHVWANNIREQEILRRTAEDPHSLGRWRVNGTLPHVDAFVQAFGIQEGDAMYLPQAERASIW